MVSRILYANDSKNCSSLVPIDELSVCLSIHAKSSADHQSSEPAYKRLSSSAASMLSCTIRHRSSLPLATAMAPL
jgi:hypothetical protein